MYPPPAMIPSGRRERKELQLQGPRPAPLRVHSASHKIRKPQAAAARPPHAPPVIIYTVSPKVFHTNPNEFMSLVQRLTGATANSTCNNSSPAFPGGGDVSPATRYASIEKTKTLKPQIDTERLMEGIEITSIDDDMEVPTSGGDEFPGILSSPDIDLINNNSFSLFFNLSPVLIAQQQKRH
ncbi:protein MKS1-like [Andrographis paniculata]|uniref:protein MKS1-like n=1 Tax=Andrographis paniculata TaxID=175694 RepID=UPI0021E981E4|nr:protein MKS1-like [Andrographis paniculata]